MSSIVKAIDTVSGTDTASKSVTEAIGKLEGLVVSDGAAAVAAALEPDGDITVAIESGAEAVVTAELEPGGDIAEAIAAAIPQAAAIEDSTADDAAGLVVDFNLLLTALRDAGLIATDGNGGD